MSGALQADELFPGGYTRMPARPGSGTTPTMPAPSRGIFYDVIYEFREDLLFDFFNRSISRLPKVNISYPLTGLSPTASEELERLISSSSSAGPNVKFNVSLSRPDLFLSPDNSLYAFVQWPITISFQSGEHTLSDFSGLLKIRGTINKEEDRTRYRFRLVLDLPASEIALETLNQLMTEIFDASRSAFEEAFSRVGSRFELGSWASPFRNLRPGEAITGFSEWRLDLAKVSDSSHTERRAIACGLVLTPEALISNPSFLEYFIEDKTFGYVVGERVIESVIFLVWRRPDTPKTARDTSVFVNLITSDSEEIPAQATMNVTFSRLSIVDLYFFDSTTADVIRLVADAALSVEQMRERGGEMREIELTDEMRNGMVNYAISITPFDTSSHDPAASPGIRLVGEISKKCVNVVCVPFIEETTSIDNVLGTVSASRHYMSYAGNLNWGGVVT
jgi:hypothetical protein